MEHGMMIVMNLLLLMLGKPNIKLTPCPGNRIAWPSRKKMGEKKKKTKRNLGAEKYPSRCPKERGWLGPTNMFLSCRKWRQLHACFLTVVNDRPT